MGARTMLYNFSGKHFDISTALLSTRWHRFSQALQPWQSPVRKYVESKYYFGALIFVELPKKIQD